MKKVIPYISWFIITVLLIVMYFVKDIDYTIKLAILSGVSFIQNMAFTLVSRSRNSGDPEYHRYCAWASNGIWFLCYTFLFSSILDDIRAQNWVPIIIVGIVYGLATAEGSVRMMKIAIKKEKGKRKVGVGLKPEDIKGLDEYVRRICNTLKYNIEGKGCEHKDTYMIANGVYCNSCNKKRISGSDIWR